MTQQAATAHETIRHFLAHCRELAAFSTQNGWPDDDTLQYRVIAESPREVTVAVTFEEVIMEGAGCVAGRQPCYGRLRLRLDERRRVIGAEVA